MLNLKEDYINRRLFAKPLQDFTFPSVKQAYKALNELIDLYTTDFQLIIKGEDNSVNQLEKFFYILNVKRLVNVIISDILCFHFKESSAYENMKYKLEPKLSLEKNNERNIIMFLNSQKARLDKNSQDYKLVYDYLLTFNEKCLSNDKINNLKRKLVKTLSKDRKGNPLVFKDFKLDNVEPEYLKLFNSYAEDLNKGYPCLFIDEFNYENVLSNVSNREIRKAVFEKSHEVSEIVELEINKLIQEYFNEAQSKNYKSILEYKLKDTNLSVDYLKKVVQKIINEKGKSLNKTAHSINSFLSEDGIEPKDLKAWDYFYYFEKCRKNWDEKKEDFVFEKKDVYRFIQEFLEKHFKFEVSYKRVKRSGLFFTHFQLSDKLLNKVLNLTLLENEACFSYFKGFVYDSYNQQSMVGFINFNCEDKLTIKNLEELFHEFGHALAFFFYKNKMDYENKKEAWEFVEIESLLMENILKQSSILNFFKINGSLVDFNFLKENSLSRLMCKFYTYQSILMDKVIIELSSRDYPFTYKELKDKIVENGILRIWASSDNRLFDENLGIYHWSEWIYPVNEEIALNIIKKNKLLSSKKQLEKNIRNVYEKYFSGNIREEIKEI